MTRPILFASDIHLAADRPAIVELFLRFLREVATEAQSLYLLGDVFEYWVGDDDVGDHVAAHVLDALATLHDGGVEVAFMAGNRDFLLGKVAARRAHMRVLADPTVINLFGRAALVTHGDAFCTDDVAYQSYRARVRRPWVVKTLRAMPLAVRHRIARGLRAKSEAEKRGKPAAIMDVNGAAVALAFQSYAVNLMIHGHTHRPAWHPLEVNGRPCERYVLADWYERGSYLRVLDKAIDAVPFS